MNIHFLKRTYFRFLIILVFCSVFSKIYAADKPQQIPYFDFNRPNNIEYSNFYNIDKMFTEMQSEDGTDEYYFAILGDTQNNVRSYDLSGFNYVAKNIIYTKDKNEEYYIYDKIKFIMHLGDIVFEGDSKNQWDNLKKAFSGKDYYGENYPYIKLLVRDKPIFPTVGNHDLMMFKFKKESLYKNLSISNIGLEHFYEFWGWESFYSNPNIMYPIPSELTSEHFNSISSNLDAEDKRLFCEYYIQREDGRFYLKIYQDIIEKYKNSGGFTEAHMDFFDPDIKDKVVKDLHRIYTNIGYNSLPTLSSDNMVCYAFEIDGLIYLVLDSMTRGWHYKVFSELKKSIYHNKEHQHYLNLFSKSDVNGQYEFFKAVKEYVELNNKRLSIFMHHSAINSNNDIDASGLEYNLKLMLGVDYDKTKYKKYSELEFDKNTSNTSFFDDILFINSGSDVPMMQEMFTACVHYYQGFKVNNYMDDQFSGSFDWHISGGGGGELDTELDDEKVAYSEMLYNERLKKESDLTKVNRSIKITDIKTRKSFHYLLVHVKGNEIVDVIPKYIPYEDIKLRRPSFFNPRVKLHTPTFNSPTSYGTLASIYIGNWGLEKFNHMLQFVTYEPSLGYGFLYYNPEGDEDYAALLKYNLLNFNLKFPNDKEVALLLLGYTDIVAGTMKKRSYWTFGVEAPLLYNFWGVQSKLNFGLQYYLPHST